MVYEWELITYAGGQPQPPRPASTSSAQPASTSKTTAGTSRRATSPCRSTTTLKWMSMVYY